MSQNMMLTER